MSCKFFIHLSWKRKTCRKIGYWAIVMLLIMSMAFSCLYPRTVIRKGPLTMNTVLLTKLFKERQLKEVRRSSAACCRNIKPIKLSLAESKMQSNKLRLTSNYLKTVLFVWRFYFILWENRIILYVFSVWGLYSYICKTTNFRNREFFVGASHNYSSPASP